MNWRLAILDVDDTILPKNAPQIPRSTIDAILAAQRSGIEIAIASRRPPEGIRAALFRSGVPEAIVADEMIVLAFNGAVALHGQEMIYAEGIDPTVARNILGFCRADEAVNAAWFVPGSCRMLKESPWLELYSRKHNIPITVADPGDGYDDILKILVLSPGGDGDKARRVDEFLRTKHVSTCRAVTQWADSPNAAEWAEVMAPGVNKGLAVRKLAERRNLKLEEIVVFGDGINDLEMLAIPEVFSVVIGKSPYREVMEAANLVANQCDGDPPGVAQVLTEYLDGRVGANSLPNQG